MYVCMYVYNTKQMRLYIYIICFVFILYSFSHQNQ